MKNVRDLRDKCSQIERSQEFLSAKYEQMMDTTQATKKQIEMTNTKVRDQADSMSTLKENIEDLYCQLDELQHYSQRDCIETTGVPKSNDENVAQTVKEVSDLVGV